MGEFRRRGANLGINKPPWGVRPITSMVILVRLVFQVRAHRLHQLISLNTFALPFPSVSTSICTQNQVPPLANVVPAHGPSVFMG